MFILINSFLAHNKTYLNVWMKNWENKTGQIEWWVTQYTITPRVRNFARNHFNCPDIEGAELNSWVKVQPKTNYTEERIAKVTDPAHWSMRLFPDEILSPVSMPGQILSDLTLSLLLDSGYYDVNNRSGIPTSLPYSAPTVSDLI